MTFNRPETTVIVLASKVLGVFEWYCQSRIVGFAEYFVLHIVSANVLKIVDLCQNLHFLKVFPLPVGLSTVPRKVVVIDCGAEEMLLANLFH
jgi:hypothetical protein